MPSYAPGTDPYYAGADRRNRHTFTRERNVSDLLLGIGMVAQQMGAIGRQRQEQANQAAFAGELGKVYEEPLPGIGPGYPGSDQEGPPDPSLAATSGQEADPYMQRVAGEGAAWKPSTFVESLGRMTMPFGEMQGKITPDMAIKLMAARQGRVTSESEAYKRNLEMAHLQAQTGAIQGGEQRANELFPVQREGAIEDLAGKQQSREFAAERQPLEMQKGRLDVARGIQDYQQKGGLYEGQREAQDLGNQKTRQDIEQGAGLFPLQKEKLQAETNALSVTAGVDAENKRLTNQKLAQEIAGHDPEVAGKAADRYRSMVDKDENRASAVTRAYQAIVNPVAGQDPLVTLAGLRATMGGAEAAAVDDVLQFRDRVQRHKLDDPDVAAALERLKSIGDEATNNARTNRAFLSDALQKAHPDVQRATSERVFADLSRKLMRNRTLGPRALAIYDSNLPDYEKVRQFYALSDELEAASRK